ncbi:MAG: HAD-IA family hydrolase [Boseongicola sp.]|nr:HAD-IA family hydrolase [Boseongicola sp.]
MRAVIFDLDGTLINSLPTITNAANALLAENGQPPVTDELTVHFVGLGERVFMERLIAATALNTRDFDPLTHRFVEYYQEFAKVTPLMPFVSEVLTDLGDAGFALGLCTNKPRAPLATTLAAAGLDKAFKVEVAGDDLPKRKPNPDPLIEAARRLESDQFIYVGDSEIDAETARNA